MRRSFNRVRAETRSRAIDPSGGGAADVVDSERCYCYRTAAVRAIRAGVYRGQLSNVVRCKLVRGQQGASFTLIKG
jgi:hypothetical protein